MTDRAKIDADGPEKGSDSPEKAADRVKKVLTATNETPMTFDKV